MHRFKGTAFFIHIAGWLLFLTFPLLFMNSEQGKSSWLLVASPYYWLFCLTYVVMFYINTWYLIPRFVFKKKFVQYGVLLLILFSCVYYLQPYTNLLGHNKTVLSKLGPAQGSIGGIPEIRPGFDTNATANLPFGPLPHQDLRMQDPNLKKPNGILAIHQSDNIDLVSLFIFMLIMGISFATTTVQQWQSTEQKVVKAEAEKVNAELSFLKAQINPHFLFNTLNNIYTLSVMDSRNTSDSIMKLSNIMRYVTDDVTNDLVRLQSEIDCIEDYIDLQRLRLGDSADVQFTLEGKVLNQRIGPLILMTFIENAFKYGVSKKQKTVISISIKVMGDQVDFYCRNRVFEQQNRLERTGIGIKNTKQRLEYLYPGKYQLTINNENQLFTVRLCVDC
ncbi:sensor histidine kinase [Hufsiella ginkgonis]|uniref:Signal transduction histidine kinase internal region domain-containing protein n=1 Tax=Hufsiella ginkgonis TaxID=2695274 RepID=A0A7K1Y103_9SPHI|nr:histidine kinase [Hufsiella ginkgonis]MXV16911.1 hypothetical protein [Hufsiella ginkgonis]